MHQGRACETRAQRLSAAFDVAALGVEREVGVGPTAPKTAHRRRRAVSKPRALRPAPTPLHLSSRASASQASGHGLDSRRRLPPRPWVATFRWMFGGACRAGRGARGGRSFHALRPAPHARASAAQWQTIRPASERSRARFPSAASAAPWGSDLLVDARRRRAGHGARGRPRARTNQTAHRRRSAA